MIKYIETSKHVLLYEGTITDDKGHRKAILTNGDGKPWVYTGTYIHSLGGYEKFLEELQESDKTIEELRNERGKQLAPVAAQKEIMKDERIALKREVLKQNRWEYYKLLESDEPNECNTRNICIILRYLNGLDESQWGELPKLKIGYKCKKRAIITKNKLNTGKTYIIMRLKDNIDIDGEPCSSFVFGHRPFGVYHSVFGSDGINDFNE
jgi:hypothetical protein